MLRARLPIFRRRTGNKNLEKDRLQYRLEKALEEEGRCTQLESARPREGSRERQAETVVRGASTEQHSWHEATIGILKPSPSTSLPPGVPGYPYFLSLVAIPQIPCL